jgi:hypothetical protein
MTDTAPAGSSRVTQATRFEVYVPTYYSEPSVDDPTSTVVRHLDPGLLAQFSAETLARYQGVTQSNPASVSPLRGVWQPSPSGPAHVDHLVTLTCLVKQHEFDDALAYFQRWKSILERELRQEVVLVVFYGVQMLGEF